MLVYQSVHCWSTLLKTSQLNLRKSEAQAEESRRRAAAEARLEKSQLKAREAYQQASKNGLFVVLLMEEVPNNHLLDV